MGIKVAVLEDDSAFREEVLVRGLFSLDFDVEGFGKSGELYRRMLSVPFELLVLDLRLEAEDGLEVARHLREVTRIGIVTLTGRGTHEEQIRGLTETVDAWLTKPVDIDVLAATLRGISRRLRQSAGGAEFRKISPERWHLSPGNWRLVSPDGRSMPLNPLERSLLARLTATQGDLVAHADLLNDLGAISSGFDQSRLEILVHRLRRKVERQFGRVLPLKSVRGCGYLLVTTDEGMNRDGKSDQGF
jgi:DNA-binding response OmpR family regulator